ncbi:MAG TPA: hypothetical protein VF252_08090 [Gemmatimonadales bacterium]
MTLPQRIPWPVLTIPLLLLLGCDKSPTSAEPTAASTSKDGFNREAAALENSGHGTPFDEAEVFFEFNTTDNDLGFQVFLDHAGWKRVSLADPRGNSVARILADGQLGDLGITELRFESAEPSPAEVLARFPAGNYTFRGLTVDGVSLLSRARLSHRFLPKPSITPRNGQVVDPRNTIVRWNAPGAELVEIIIEHPELGHNFDVIVSGSTTRLTVPPQFLRRGQEYKIEILAIAENGNRTIVESTFRTAP